jgi:hypothetical protein
MPELGAMGAERDGFVLASWDGRAQAIFPHGPARPQAWVRKRFGGVTAPFLDCCWPSALCPARHGFMWRERREAEGFVFQGHAIWPGG